MKTDQTRRAEALLGAFHDACEWRETFEARPEHAIVSFQSIYMSSDTRRTSRSLTGFDGELEMPRDMAIRTDDEA